MRMAASNGAEKMNLNVKVDEALMKRILDTHQHEDVKKLDPNPLLHAIRDVIQRAKGIPVEGYSSNSEGHLRYNLQHLPYEAIKSVSCEFSCKCSGVSTTSEVAIGLLQLLGSYSWEAKAAITLAAFAANYGSYFSVSQLYGSNDPFSKSLAFLQLSPNLLKQAPLKLKPEALKVVEAILGLTNYIVEIKDFQSKYVQRKIFSSFFAAHEDDLAKAVYLSIQSTVACASILMNTVALGNEYKPTAMEAQELSDLAMEITNIRSTLASEMESWKKHIESIILTEDYDKLVGLFKREHTDNMEILQALLCWNQSHLTSIYNCSTKTQEELNKLSGKHVFLYISNLGHLSEEEISILSENYARKSTPCEIVWVPIVDISTSWNEEIEKYFKKMRDSMGWYSINDPWKLNKAVIKYIEEEWKFEGESEFVVLNPKGKFVISGAVNLFWFLEQSSFQVDYWKTIQLLQQTMGSIVNNWIDAGKHIFLFGGEDIKWIQKFVDEAQRVAVAAKIDFVMMYAGKSNLKWAAHQEILEILEQLKKNNTTLPVYRFGDQKYMSSFWATLRSIWQTKIKTGKSIVISTTMDDIATLLSFDAIGEGWAAICRGSSPEMAKARGKTFLDILKNNSGWEALGKQGFVEALAQKINEGKTLESHHDCYSLEVAATRGSTPKKVKCRLCDCAMKTFITYRCCGDH
ncbi:protein SIEVE ELEMENT OCCLUSION B-like isoform X1 [Diospyros lotus]|uniref:protein SIEVE ELEMENT OCCLUSION B-like isoform X1 n=1 Tax=Diospyros lotus TaxID=55363 RepID=UPI002255D36A|nr:protein SIEVE ELEMENT OCCLUSION B-like isoform X1 [Diospyros lotus]